jgi:diguanylate cyclase (GGDEF)-like protein
LAKQVIAYLEARLYAGELEATVKNLQQKEEEIAHYQKELESANAALKDLSVRGDLTQVRNRRAFRERLDADYRLAMRHKQPLSLALIDVDHFKEFNDTYGHAVGDRVLRDVARILVETSRSTDCVARYGGEEFIVLLPNTDAAGARIISDRFRNAIEDWKVKHDGATVSVGVATLESTG